MASLVDDLKQPLPLQILIRLLVDHISTGVLILLLKEREGRKVAGEKINDEGKKGGLGL